MHVPRYEILYGYQLKYCIFYSIVQACPLTVPPVTVTQQSYSDSIFASKGILVANLPGGKQGTQGR